MATRFLSQFAAVAERPWLPAALFLAALAIRAIAAAAIGDFNPNVEIWEYGLQGWCAAENHRDLCLWDSAVQPYASALMPPLTSYLWLGIFSVFEKETLAAHLSYVALNVVIGAACAPLLYRLAREIGMSAAAAFIAGMIIAAYPTFVFVSAGYHATNFTVALMLAFTILLLRAARDFSWKTALAAGIVGGLAAMTRNELLIIAAAATLWLFWLGRRDWKPAFRAAAALTIGVGIVCAPWIARNYATFHSFIPIGSQGGYNVWIGFGPYARGSGNELDNNPEARAAAQRIRQSVTPGDPADDRYEPRLQRAFLEDAQPALQARGVAQTLWLTAQKFTLLWVFDWTDPLTQTSDYWGPWLFVHMLALYGVYALWRARAPPIEPNGAAVIVLFLSIFTLAYSITSVFARYRMHMEPFIFLLAAVGAWAILTRFARD